MKFILFFVAKHTINNFLPYGYVSRSLIWIWLLLIYLFAIKIEKQKFLLWNDNKYSFLFYIISIISIVGLVILCSYIPRVLVLFGLKTEHSLLLNQMRGYMNAHHLLLVFICLTAGVVEELIFRGYLIPRLNILFNNNYLPVIVSAVLFGAVHFTYGTVENIIVPIFIGLIFGFHYQKYRNLKVLILCHFLVDLF
jgi:membrane protease YdiL (CAAX protease family)